MPTMSLGWKPLSAWSEALPGRRSKRAALDVHVLKVERVLVRRRDNHDAVVQSDDLNDEAEMKNKKTESDAAVNPATGSPWTPGPSWAPASSPEEQPRASRTRRRGGVELARCTSLARA